MEVTGKPAVHIERVGQDRLELVLPLFERYRSFYGCEPDARRAEAFLRARLEGDQSVLFAAIAESTSEAAGFAQLYPSYSSLSLAPTWILNDLYVEQAYRRAGLGRLLVEHVTGFASERGAVAVTLETAASNRAAKDLYASLGYQLDAGFDHYIHRMSSG